MYADLNQKTCTNLNCKKLKDFSEFHKNKNRPDGLSAWCKSCKSKSDAKIYKKNPTKVKIAAKIWKSKNSEAVKISNAGYKKRNPDKVNKGTREYKKQNRGVTNANTAKRRAALLRRTPVWLNEFELQQIQALYKKAAEITKTTGIPHEVDHIIPLQGKDITGLHVFSNLQILAEKLNESKGCRYKI